MSKRIPFNIKYRPQIESDEYKVETKGGEPVHILSFEALGPCPICYQVGDGMDADFPPGPEVCFANNNGECSYSPNSLFIVTPEEELTEFEKAVYDCAWGKVACKTEGESKEEYAKRHAATLLSLAREQFIKDGYVIEKKAFHDAVEKIDDKYKAEMSIEYSLHCKIENRTRHAVMNWQEFQELAQKFINIGKAEALKDLPRWKKIGQGNNYSSETKFCINGRYIEMNDTLNCLYEIALKDLEKLPKEDKK